MNAMIVLSLTDIDMLNTESNISDAPHRIKPSPDGASLVQATLADKNNGGKNTELHEAGKGYGVIKLVKSPKPDDPHWSIDGK